MRPSSARLLHMSPEGVPTKSEAQAVFEDLTARGIDPRPLLDHFIEYRQGYVDRLGEFKYAPVAKALLQERGPVVWDQLDYQRPLQSMAQQFGVPVYRVIFAEQTGHSSYPPKIAHPNLIYELFGTENDIYGRRLIAFWEYIEKMDPTAWRQVASNENTVIDDKRYGRWRAWSEGAPIVNQFPLDSRDAKITNITRALVKLIQPDERVNFAIAAQRATRELRDNSHVPYFHTSAFEFNPQRPEVPIDFATLLEVAASKVSIINNQVA